MDDTFLLNLSIAIMVFMGAFGVSLGTRRKNYSLIACGGFLLFLSVFVLTDTFPKFGVTISACATSAVAVFALVQISENRRVEKRELEERQLREILDWVAEVKSCDLIEFPCLLPDQESSTKFLTYNAQIRKAKALVGSEIVMSIVLHFFKDEANLINSVKAVRNNLIASRFLDVPVKAGMSSEYLKIIENVEERLNRKEKREDLIHEYGTNLVISANALSSYIFDMISNL